LTPHEVFLAKLIERDPQCGRGRIFTLNYDTLLEQTMDRLGIVYCDGFTGTVSRRFNPAAYDLDLHYPGEATEGRVRRYDKVLQLYKLHGSINWRKRIAAGANIIDVYCDLGPLPSRLDVKAAAKGKRDILTSLFHSGTGLAVLPTANKYSATLTMPYAHLFRGFGQALREPQTVLFIVGYSGWDDHVNRIIEDALTNPSFTCVIIDPQPSHWARSLCAADYCGRVYCLGGQWGTFEFFAKEVLPDIEVLKTELLVARTLRDLQKSRTQINASDGDGTPGAKDD